MTLPSIPYFVNIFRTVKYIPCFIPYFVNIFRIVVFIPCFTPYFILKNRTVEPIVI